MSITPSLLIIILLIISIWIIVAGLWKFIKEFFHNNYSFFDVSFVIAYFLEQLALIILLAIDPDKTTFWVSAFALLVITTASIQKVSMDSRDRKIRELNKEYSILLERTTNLLKESKKREISMAETIKRLREKLK